MKYPNNIIVIFSLFCPISSHFIPLIIGYLENTNSNQLSSFAFQSSLLTSCFNPSNPILSCTKSYILILQWRSTNLRPPAWRTSPLYKWQIVKGTSGISCIFLKCTDFSFFFLFWEKDQGHFLENIPQETQDFFASTEKGLKCSVSIIIPTWVQVMTCISFMIRHWN